MAGVGKKRPGGMNFFGTYMGNIEGYNADFLYDTPNKREIGQLMFDMIYRIEQKAQQEEEIIQRINRMRSEQKQKR